MGLIVITAVASTWNDKLESVCDQIIQKGGNIIAIIPETILGHTDYYKIVYTERVKDE